MSTTTAPVPATVRRRGRIGQERTNWPVTILLILENYSSREYNRK